MIFLYYTTLILIYDVLLPSRLYYIQFKRVKISCGPGLGAKAGHRGPDMWARGWITQTHTFGLSIGMSATDAVIQQQQQKNFMDQVVLRNKLGILQH